MITVMHIMFLILKNNAPFLKCISKTSNILIDNTKDLYIVQLD